MVNLMLGADPACDSRITVRWSSPDYLGTIPELDENGVYVGPDYIGGERAGKEEVGEDATSLTYQVQRMVNHGAWVAVTTARGLRLRRSARPTPTPT
jgi:hypothetical protein